MSILLHCGAEAVNYDALRLLTTPDPTATHVPIPHHRVVDLVKHTLSFYGHEVTGETHALTKDGDRYFGLLSLKSNYGMYEDTVIMRNSHDKKFPIGIGFGSRTFVCDNLAFIADHVVKRKHTIRAKHELPALVSEIVEPLANEREAQHRKVLTYQNTQVNEKVAHHAIMLFYKLGVVNLQRLPEVLEQWERPSCDWGNGSAWHLFNACTYALNGRVAENPQATTQLHQVIDVVCKEVN